MNLDAYLLERSRIETLAVPFAVADVLLSLVVLAACVIPAARRWAPYAIATLAGTLLIGFAVLAGYHWRIYQSIVLLNPVTGEASGRFMIPLWIEGEKLYFETLLLGIFAVALARRSSPLTASVGALFAALALLTGLFSNPFAAPLPDLHKMLTQTASMLSAGGVNLRMPAYQQAYGQMRFFYNSAYMWVHPPLLFASYAAFAVSFIACLHMLGARRSDYDRAAYDAAKLGYLLLTFGILIGYPWAVSAWGDSPWWWAPKINMALMLWFLYTGYLHARLFLGRKGMWKTTAALGVACFAALILTYVTTYVVPGTHSVA